MPSLTDELIESWPHPLIAPVAGEPAHEDIAKINLQLNANAASVFSALGNGELGLLALTITPEVCALHSVIPFVAPVNPGPAPTYSENPAQHQIQLANQQHSESLRVWKEHTSADKALK